MYYRVLFWYMCPLLGGLSSFGVSFIVCTVIMQKFHHFRKSQDFKFNVLVAQFIGMYIHMMISVLYKYARNCDTVYTVHARMKFLFRIRSTLSSVIMEDTLEPFHLCLVLSTSPMIINLFCQY